MDQEVRRAHHGTNYVRGQRRKLVWAETGQAGTIGQIGSTPGVSNVDLLAGYRAAGGSTQGITIMRTHISYSVFLHSAAIASDGVALGLVIDDNSQTVATLNSSEVYKDWMYLNNFYPASGQAGGVSGTGWTYGFHIDLKAKRKCQELNQSLYLSQNALSANVTDVAYRVRVLLALP
jgi:hypothetical protein